MCTLGRAQSWVSMKAKEYFYHSNLEYERSLKRTTIEILVDMAAWFGETTRIFGILLFSSGVFLGISVLSLAEILYWVLRAFTGTYFMDLTINTIAQCSGHLWSHYDN